MTETHLRHESGAARREGIMAALRTVGIHPIADLARQLGVFQMTVRCDLHALEGAGEVRMFHGGAGLAPSAARGAVFPDDGETETETEWE